jgi:hypothetical protein
VKSRSGAAEPLVIEDAGPYYNEPQGFHGAQPGAGPGLFLDRNRCRLVEDVSRAIQSPLGAGTMRGGYQASIGSSAMEVT